jgi:hypothetical protein
VLIVFFVLCSLLFVLWSSSSSSSSSSSLFLPPPLLRRLPLKQRPPPRKVSACRVFSISVLFAPSSVFCAAASKLLSKITGSEGSAASSQDFMRTTLAKQSIVARSHISYDNDSLLKLIHQHLLHSGLPEVRCWTVGGFVCFVCSLVF